MAEPIADQARAGAAGGSPGSRTSEVLRARLVRVSPLLVVGLAIVLVLAGQLAEDFADSEPLQLLTPMTGVRRWTLIVAVAYMLAISHVVERYVQRSLSKVSEVVEVDRQRFAGYAQRMRRPDLAVDVALLGLAAVVVTGLFWFLDTSLPIDDPITQKPLYLRGSAIGSLLILVQYSLLGWALLSLLYCTIRRSRALAALSRERLVVDVFDTTNLLPLGNIALSTALAPAGIVVILLFGFGRPSAPVSWTLLLLVTVASVFSLLQPLRGFHQQMEVAKWQALRTLNARLREIYEAANLPLAEDAGEAGRLNNRVGLLVNLRKTVGEMTTWPFRDTLAFGRAVLIAAAPLIYAVINELIKAFWIGPLTR
jgi:hypothetical protein